MNRNQRMLAAGIVIMFWVGSSGISPAGALVVGLVGSLLWDVYFGGL